MRKIRRTFISLILAALIGLTFSRPSLAAPNPPGYDVYEYEVPAGALCSFALHISVDGQKKTIELPGDRTTEIYPGEFVTLTNLDDPSKQVTENITGSFHIKYLPDGSTETVFTGRNLVWDPFAGFVFVFGHFGYAIDANGNLTQPLHGEGKIVDACALIS